MLLRQFHLPSLGHASYLLASGGEALIVDPRRDVEPYLEAADEAGVRIAKVLDTHGHNDYVSGILELADRAGAEPLASAEGSFRYRHRPLKDGDVLELGDLRLEVLHTPGHTPEHIALLVRDGTAGDGPTLLLSGGALLVGDVARPDLLGGDVGEAAASLCRMLEERILPLPDHVEVFPTHVSGSLCATNIGAALSTTIGVERRTNPVLRRAASREPRCVDLDHLPAIPPHWPRLRAANMAGPPLVGPVAPPPDLGPEAVEEALGRGAVVLDVRGAAAWAEAHLPGSLNAGLDGSFPTWAGTVLPERAAIVVVADGPDDAFEAARLLPLTGARAPIGWLAGGVDAWRSSGRRLATVPAISVEELRERLEAGEVSVLDVRQPAEWEAGHIEGAIFVTGAEVAERVGDIPADRPVATMCGSGYRSTVIASLLAARDREVVTVLGGMGAWRASGYPVA